MDQRIIYQQCLQGIHKLGNNNKLYVYYCNNKLHHPSHSQCCCFHHHNVDLWPRLENHIHFETLKNSGIFWGGENYVILFYFNFIWFYLTLTGQWGVGGGQHGRLFSLPSQRNFPVSFKPKVVIAKFVWKMQKNVWYICFCLSLWYPVFSMYVYNNY